MPGGLFVCERQQGRARGDLSIPSPDARAKMCGAPSKLESAVTCRSTLAATEVCEVAKDRPIQARPIQAYVMGKLRATECRKHQTGLRVSSSYSYVV